MRCPACGISYADPRVAELGRTLLRADAIRQALQANPQPSIPPRPGAPGVATRPARPAPAAITPSPSGPGRAATPAAGSPGVGWILLAVGALCLAVAAAIFIAVTWNALGWLQRGAIMLGVTGVFGALTETARRKRLRASTETLAAVTGLLWTVTLVAGTRLLPDSAWWPALIGLAIGGPALIADLWHARRGDRLWAVDALAGLALLILFGGVYQAAGEWRPIVPVLALGVGIACHLRRPWARLLLLRGAGLALGAVAALVLASQGLLGLASADWLEGWRVMVLLVTLGVLVRVTPDRPVRWGSAACAGLLGAGALMAATSQLPFDLVVWLVLAIAVPGLLASLGPQGTDEGSRVARLAGIGWLVLPGTMGVGLVLAVIVLMVQGPALDQPGPWWTLSTIGYVGLALAAAVLGSRRLPRRVRVLDALALLGAWTVSLVLVHASAAVALGALAPTLIVLLLLARRTRSLVSLGSAAALAGWLCLLVVAGGWVAPAALFVVGSAALVWSNGSEPLRVPAHVLGWLTLPTAILVSADPLRAAGFPGEVVNTSVVVAVASLAALVLATHQWWWLDRPSRVVAESAGLAWSVAAASLALGLTDLPVVSLCLLLFGIALLVAGRTPDRRAYPWIALAVLTLSSWALLIDRNASTVEWFTLPTALVLLALGTRRLLRDPAASSWRTLLPGLLLGLLPSALLGLAEPVSVRALIVGLVSVALILVGLFRHLAACFGTGAITLVVLAAVELWPYAAHVPRWAGFAGAGVLLVAVGVRWEARLRDVRRMGGYLRGLR